MIRARLAFAVLSLVAAVVLGVVDLGPSRLSTQGWGIIRATLIGVLLVNAAVLVLEVQAERLRRRAEETRRVLEASRASLHLSRAVVDFREAMGMLGAELVAELDAKLRVVRDELAPMLAAIQGRPVPGRLARLHAAALARVKVIVAAPATAVLIWVLAIVVWTPLLWRGLLALERAHRAAPAKKAEPLTPEQEWLLFETTVIQPSQQLLESR